MIRSIFIFAISILLSLDASAQNRPGNEGPQGSLTTSFGAPDCGEWVNGTRPGSKIWLSGYMSGLNRMFNISADRSAAAYDPISTLSSMDQAFVWMDNWCRSNPLEGVDSGAQHLLLELIALKSKR